MLAGGATPALFLAGAATVLLLFISIHNAWDTATCLVFTLRPPGQDVQDERRGADAR